MKPKLILPFFLLAFFSVHSQIVRNPDGSPVQEEFVEDAKNYDKSFALKTDILRAALGELMLAGELRASRSIGVEANVMCVYHGFLLPLGLIYDFKDTYQNIPTIGGGAAVRFYEPRIFSSRSTFLEFRYKFKQLKRTSDEVLPGIDDNSLKDTYHIIMFSWGRQFLQTNSFLFEYVVGLGYSHCIASDVSYDQFTDEYTKRTYRPNVLDDGYAPLAINVGFRIGLLPF